MKCSICGESADELYSYDLCERCDYYLRQNLTEVAFGSLVARNRMALARYIELEEEFLRNCLGHSPMVSCPSLTLNPEECSCNAKVCLAKMDHFPFDEQQKLLKKVK